AEQRRARAFNEQRAGAFDGRIAAAGGSDQRASQRIRPGGAGATAAIFALGAHGQSGRRERELARRGGRDKLRFKKASGWTPFHYERETARDYQDEIRGRAR